MRAKKKKVVPVGVIHVTTTFNSTTVTATDVNGNVYAWASSGSSGFKGSRKSTPFAAQTTAEDVATRIMAAGTKTVSVKVKGPGAGREPAVRALVAKGLTVTMIQDVTPVPHNGCRPPKRRRV